MLLIMRILATTLLLWLVSYVYILSSNRIQDVGMEKVWTKGKIEKSKLQEKLAFAEKLGSLDDCMIARTNWMLYLLKMNVVDESVKQAKLLLGELGRAKKITIEEKISYMEDIAIVYRSAGKYELLTPIYKNLIADIESLKDPQKEELLVRVKNNMAVSKFFKGLSTPAFSKKGFDQRIKRLEEAKKDMIALSKQIEKSDHKSSNTAFETSKIIEDNMGEFNLEMEYALLRKKEYDR